MFESSVEGLKEDRTRLIQTLGGLVVADTFGFAVQPREGDPGFKEALGLVQAGELLQRGHDGFVGVAFLALAFGVDGLVAEQAWPRRAVGLTYASGRTRA